MYSGFSNDSWIFGAATKAGTLMILVQSDWAFKMPLTYGSHFMTKTIGVHFKTWASASVLTTNFNSN